MAAKYMVTAAPGAPITGVGFVQPGQVFTAPSADYVPSRTFRPVNDEAKAALEKVFDDRKAALEQALETAKRDDDPDSKKIVSSLRRALKDLDNERPTATTVIELAKPTPVVEEGLTLKELAELSTAPPSASSPLTKPSTTPSTGKRAADK